MVTQGDLIFLGIFVVGTAVLVIWKISLDSRRKANSNVLGQPPEKHAANFPLLSRQQLSTMSGGGRTQAQSTKMSHAALVKKMEAEMSFEMRRKLNNGQIWEDRNKYIFRVVDENGDGLKGIWTGYADEVFLLVYCGYVKRNQWQAHFNENLPQPTVHGGGDIEAIAASRDPDQKARCMDGLRTIIDRHCSR